jgi:hypothetical protein
MTATEKVMMRLTTLGRRLDDVEETVEELGPFVGRLHTALVAVWDILASVEATSRASPLRVRGPLEEALRCHKEISSLVANLEAQLEAAAAEDQTALDDAR